jgi:hypothetical protein
LSNRTPLQGQSVRLSPEISPTDKGVLNTSMIVIAK